MNTNMFLHKVLVMLSVVFLRLRLTSLFSLCQISKKDSGVYEVVLKDDRGKDTSTLNLTDQGDLHWRTHTHECYLSLLYYFK